MNSHPQVDSASILVTGAGGFLGRALVDRLRRTGAEIHGTYHSAPTDVGGLAESNSHVGSIVDVAFVEECFEAARPDYVYHLAAQTSPTETLERVNVEGTKNVLDAAESDVDGVIFTSSAKRYADTDEQSSVTDPIGVKDRYGASKRAAELLCSAYHERRGLPVAVAIPFLLYGPRELNPRGLIPAAIRCASNDEPFEVQCSTHVRDPVYIDDAVEALVEAMGHLGRSDWFEFNICRGSPLTVREIVTTIYDVVDAESSPDFNQLDRCNDEESYLVGDPSRTEALLGWRANTSWEEGIERVIGSFEDKASP